MSLIISFLAAGFYGAACVLLYCSLSNARPSQEPFPNTSSTALGSQTNGATGRIKRFQRLALLLASIALIMHGWVVFQQTGLPLALSLPLLTSLAATSLTIVLLHIALCLKQPADYLGILVYPIAGASLVASQAVSGGNEIIGEAIQVHVFLSLVAYGLLALAAAQAILVSIQRHYLSKHKPGGFIRALPPLDTTESLLFILLGTGFLLLSLSLASGFFFLEDMFAQHLVHKTVLSSACWFIFGVLLFGRWQFGWRGKKVVQWTLAGFVMLITAYFGSKIVLEIFLS